MEGEIDSDLDATPITALRPSTRQIIVNELNKRKVLASEEGLPRDWRGLAHLTGLPEPAGDSPADQLLTNWGRRSDACLKKLEEFLGRMDRWDIVDDVYHLIREDAKIFASGVKKYTAELNAADSSVDCKVLTYDDIRRLEEGLEPQLYDALLLYADQDEAFARQMYDRLENDYHLKVCLKESMIGGLAFEHQGILQLISERCRRVIIILSRSFLESPVNRFSVSFAQAFAIENRRRIIIPCVYEIERIDLPQEIQMLYKLDYNRATQAGYNFWEQLRLSVVQPRLPQIMSAQCPITVNGIRPSTVAIREITTSEHHHLREIEPKTQETLMKPPPYTATETIEYKLDHIEVKEKDKLCSSTSLNGSCKISCNTLSLPEKAKTTGKIISAFRKVFKSNASKSKNKSQKIAIKL